MTERGPDARSTDMASGGGPPTWLAASLKHCTNCGGPLEVATLPVIGVPMPTKALDGLDSLLSIVQMPRGIPVATVAIGNAENAALLAIEILALSDAALAKRLERFRADQTQTVLDDPSNAAPL